MLVNYAIVILNHIRSLKLVLCEHCGFFYHEVPRRSHEEAQSFYSLLCVNPCINCYFNAHRKKYPELYLPNPQSKRYH